MKKRLIALLMVCCMLLSVLPVTAMAAQVPPQVEPQWTNTSGVTMHISFSDRTGYVALSIVGHSGVSNITADIQMYFKNSSGDWVEMPLSWSYDVDQMYLSVEETFTGVRGREYMAIMTATVTKGTYGEPLSKTASDTCPTLS